MPALLLFWLVAFAIVAGALAAIIWPLVRRRAAVGPDAAPVTIYRDQKRQLDDELAARAIDAGEHAAAEHELVARLAGELEAAPHAATREGSRRGRLAWVAGLAVAFPVVAIALYVLLGNPGAMRAATASAQTPPMSPTQVAALVDRLAAHMKAHPEDADGWRLLARSYGSLGRFRDAADAFHEAAQRGPVDADLLADWADALGMANGQTLVGEPTRLIERALAIDPANVKALLLAASAAEERHDMPAAIDAWRRLKVELPPGSPEVREIDTLIARAGGAGADGVGASTAAANTAAAKSAGPAGTAAPRPTDAVDAAASISGEVSIAPSLATRVAPGDTLFIYARATDGPRMPLAAVKEAASPLPRSFTLGDAQSMRADAKLSATRAVIVEARISRSGNALPSAGDLFGSSAPVSPGARHVAVVIGDIVK